MKSLICALFLARLFQKRTWPAKCFLTFLTKTKRCGPAFDFQEHLEFFCQESWIPELLIRVLNIEEFLLGFLYFWNSWLQTCIPEFPNRIRVQQVNATNSKNTSSKTMLTFLRAIFFFKKISYVSRVDQPRNNLIRCISGPRSVRDRNLAKNAQVQRWNFENFFWNVERTD